MTLVVNDTFTESSDTALTSHTADIGSGYTMVAGGACTVRAVQDDVIDNSGGSGNRVVNNTAIGTANQIVEMDITLINTQGFLGLLGRYDGTDWIEAFYDGSLGSGGFGQYRIDDVPNGTNNAYDLTSGEAWGAGQTRKLRLEITGTVSKLYVDGVLKVTHTAGNNVTNTKAGFMLGNFSGAAGKVGGDNLKIWDGNVVSSKRYYAENLLYQG